MISLNKIKHLICNAPIADITYKYNRKINHAYVNLCWYSLTGSVKDRVAYQIFSDALKQKLINKNTRVVEVSSGNMGISVCAIANLLGLKTTIIMPKTMSEERKQLIKLYGADLVLVEDFKSAFELLKHFKKIGYFCPHQFENTSNIKAHYKFTGAELYKKLNNSPVTAFVSGVGTSGTLMGAGKFLKEKMGLNLIAIEPKNAPILSRTSPIKNHQIQGLSDEIVPEIYNENIVDEILQISDDDAIKMAQKLCKEFSLGVGISSGANFLGCVLSNQNACTIFADSNKKYLSTNLSQKVESSLVDKIDLLDIKIL